MQSSSRVDILYSSFAIAQIEAVFRHFEGGVQKTEYQKGTSMHQRVVGAARQPADIILVVFAKTGNCSLVLSDLAKNNNLAKTIILYIHTKMSFLRLLHDAHLRNKEQEQHKH